MGRLMRILTPILCALLALAAAGRFAAEASVREARGELAGVRAEADAEAAKADRLRLEVEVLESASRFEDVNAQTLRLEAPAPDQYTRGTDFARALGREADAEAAPEGSDVIGNAITFADPEAVPARTEGLR